VDVDDDERALRAAPIAEFDPASGIVPLPNALIIDPATGRVNVPPACAETPGSAAELLRLELNQLDGFGTSKQQLVATFSEAVDPASLEGRVFVARVAERGVPLVPPELVDALVVTSTTLRAAPDCQSSTPVPIVAALPREPLRDASTYAVLIASGVTTESGAEIQPSATWALVRQQRAPVEFPEGGGEAALPSYNATPFDPAVPADLAALRGLDQLWRGHAPLLQGLDLLGPALFSGRQLAREDILLAWAFRTQTIADPFDPDVAGSPVSAITAGATALTLPAAAAGGASPISVEQFYAAAFPGVPCASLACEAIGAIYAAGPASAPPTFTSSSYLSGDDCTLPATAGNAFDDPIQPTLACQRQVPALVVVPLAAPGAAGYPTVIFGHGLGRSKEDLLAIAGGLASAGIASVSIDALDHGGRAVQTSTDAASGCDRAGPDRPCTDVFGPTCAAQCFAPLLSADLAVTRDHLRQTAFDHIALGRSLAACAAPGVCGLQVDASRIGYLGQSLGSLIGALSVARSPDVSAGVLNVGGGDWMQILTDTATAAIRCPLVDTLIAGGVLSGQPWDLGANDDALCLGDAWKTDPGFLQFASAARWMLDPADAVNHALELASDGLPPVLLQEVAGDEVVPNSATLELGTALGLSPVAGDLAAGATLTPTPAAAAPGSAWIRYENLAADPVSMFPGNAYAHGSLLAPATPSATMVAPAGELGTLRMQTDSIGFLVTHLGGTP
jgi:dienelactone hydrolase